jgi:hypothetical protein
MENWDHPLRRVGAPAADVSSAARKLFREQALAVWTTQPSGASSTARLRGGARVHDAAAGLGRRALLVCHRTVKDVILAVVVWSIRAFSLRFFLFRQ